MLWVVAVTATAGVAMKARGAVRAATAKGTRSFKLLLREGTAWHYS